MAEGDTIHRTARRLNAAIGGERVTGVSVPNPMSPLRLQSARLGRLRGKRLLSAEARGKHLLLHFERELALHCHLGMNGSWRIDEPGARRARSAWVVLSTTHAEAAQLAERASRCAERVSFGPTPGSRAWGRTSSLQVSSALHRERRPFGRPLSARHSGKRCSTSGWWRAPAMSTRSEGCFAASLDPWRPVSASSLTPTSSDCSRPYRT